jgi:hypothetical protein
LMRGAPPRRPSRAGAHAADFGGAAAASLGALAARVSGRGADSLYRDADVGDSRMWGDPPVLIILGIPQSTLRDPEGGGTNAVGV